MLDLGGAQHNIRRGNIFLEIYAALGAGNGHDVVTLVQQPGERDLSRCRPLVTGNIANGVGRAHVRFEIAALKTGIAATVIALGIFLRGFRGTGKKSPTERAERHETDAKRAQERHDLRLQITFPERIFALQRAHRMDGMRAPDVRGPRFGESEKPYLAFTYQRAHRVCDLLDRHARIDAVLVQQVDAVGPEPAERCLGHLPDMFGAAVDADGFSVADGKTEFRGNHHGIAFSLESTADKVLVHEWSVHFRRIEEVHPKLDGAVNGGNRFRVVELLAVGLAHAHAAEAKRRNLESLTPQFPPVKHDLSFQDLAGPPYLHAGNFVRYMITRNARWRTDMHGKSVLLIVGGGIAAYKTLELIRRLRERHVRVRAILTNAGAQFVTPLSISALAGEKTYQDLFSLTDETEMGHIQLSRSADLLVVAPATADLMAKLANGLANDLASTALLATDKPVLMAPAMNVRMWNNPATLRNRARLEADGVAFVGPADGEMACGEFGPGRMAEPDQIVAAIETMLVQQGPLFGRKALVTAGPTREPIDPVRYLSNHSSGKQGYAIARALADAGAETTLVSGPVELAAPPHVKLVKVESAREMLAACEHALPVDVAVLVAAVSDWRPNAAADRKIKKSDNAEAPELRLVRNPDILASLAQANARPTLVIGFAAETESVVDFARVKRDRKGADWIVANDVSAQGGAMGGDANRVHLVSASGVEDWPLMDKAEVARRLARRIVAELASAAE